MSKLRDRISKDELKLVDQLYWRTQHYACLFTYSRWCGNFNVWNMWPFVKWLYPNPEDKEKRIETLKRERGLLNITPQMYPILVSLFCNMEKEAKNNPDFDVSVIDAIRASLQGPFCGVGDAIWWVTMRLIATGVALPFAQAGNILGAIIFLLVLNVPSYIFRYYALYGSYVYGADIVSKAEESGLFAKLVRGASIVGLIMIGYMVAANVSVPLNVVFTISGTEYNLLELINDIVPGILSLGVIALMMKLLEKKIKVLYLIFGLMAACLLLAFIGIF